MVFGVIYRYSVWVRRPSTAMLNRRGWDAFRQRKAHNAAALPSLVATQLLAQFVVTYGRPETLVPPDKLEIKLTNNDLRLAAPRWTTR